MNFLNKMKRPSSVILLVVVILTVLLAALSYRRVVSVSAEVVPPTPVVLATSVATRVAAPTATPVIPLLPVQNPSQILGIEGNPGTNFTGIPWVRLAYKTCNAKSGISGAALKGVVGNYHKEGIRVLLTYCQGIGKHLFDQAQLNDAALSLPDAVQCGNEEMKLDPAVAFLYVAPQNFATFYNACSTTMHVVRPEIPILLGSLDPHVGGIDVQQIQSQVDYLNQVQTAMNKTVHPGGHWDWRTQIVGLIDSWHNGYPDASVNNLASLFTFWAQQFHVDLNSGQLGKHLWVVEGTGCFKGCGVDESAQGVAIAHILSLITDVQTVVKYKTPFFYFSGRDFTDQGYYWPIGVLDAHDKDKPIRQDLSAGARTLILSCPTGKVTVGLQLQLLAKLYAHCSLPANYFSIVTN